MSIFLLGTSPVYVQSQEDSLEEALNTPEWQLTLDVIAAKAQAMLNKNNKLMAEQESLKKEYQQQQLLLSAEQDKNRELREFLNVRRGRSEEDFKKDELKMQSIKKRAQLLQIQEQIAEIKRQTQQIEQRIQLKKLKISDLHIDRNQQDLQAGLQIELKKKEISQDDDETITLKGNVAQQKEAERLLEKKLKDLRLNQMVTNAAPKPVTDQEIKVLDDKLQILLKQKEDLQNRLNKDNNEVHLVRYQKLISRKNDVEEKIKSLESQLNLFKFSANNSLSDNQSVKQLVKQMAQIDGRNAQLRQKVTVFRQNVDLLKVRVKQLERRVNMSSKPVQKIK